MKIETITLSEERHVTLTAILQEVGGQYLTIPRRPAVLVLPGGGYAMCSDLEAEPVALAYAEAGYQAFILRYTVGKGTKWPQPLEDCEAAMDLIRSHSETWHLYPDKLAVVGFSAGGHLAAAAATMAKSRPNAAILGYPVIDQETAQQCLAGAPDIPSAVDGQTCPCFLFATRTDNVVPIRNSIRMMDALDEAGIGFESHVYNYGPHGFSVCTPAVMRPGTAISSRAQNWVRDSIGWLGDLFGEFDLGRLSKPRCSARVNDDLGDYLSVDCSMELLLSNPEAQKILSPMMEAAQKTMAEKYGDMVPANGEPGNAGGLGINMTLRSALAYGNTPAETVDRLDALLKRIPNRRH